MILRPIESNGDIMPVLSTSALLSGPEAVTQLVQYRLSLLQGEWWENPSRGFAILELFSSSRLTDADADMLSSRITEYIRETPGVQSVEDVRSAVFGRQFSYSCSVLTKEGSANVVFSTVY